MPVKTYLVKGFEELQRALLSPAQWLYLGVLDIKLRYRRSMIGPWWVTISTGIMILMLSFFWSHIFGSDIRTYMPFFAIGFVLWNWMSSQIIDAASGLFQFQAIIKQIKLPFPIFVLRLNVRQFIVFFHNALIILLTLLFTGQGFSWLNLLAIPHLILIQVIISLMAIIISIFCTRYQDMTQVVNVVTQIVFFLTPIIWQVGSVRNRLYLAEWNPIYHWIEMVRAPLLGQVPTASDFLCSLASLILLMSLATYTLGRYRTRISYWL